jgi:predicted ATPase/DNA-binding CsgD family transcriptional regulator
VHEIGELLGRHRVVVLLGPGGVGKTRLALETAKTIGGATFVDLGAVTDAGHLAAAFAAALGIKQRSDEDGVIAALSSADGVLIIDNAEHVVDPLVRLLRRILTRAPSLRLLVTSRHPLGLDGEELWRVPPLAEDQAVRLFVDRARAFVPDLVGDSHVEAICRHLDGLPLAIELVAARSRAFALSDLAAQVATSVSSFRDPRRGQPERQQTIDDSVAWSWRLLGDREQRLLARLAVFPAAFPLDAAQTVAGAEHETLLSLVDHSLVRVDDRSTSTRYRLFEVVRAFARDRLLERGEEADVHDHLVAWCLQSLSAPVTSGAAVLDAVVRELPTYRAAMRWCLDHDRAVDGLRIATALSQYWETRDCGEGLSWLVPLHDAVTEPCIERALGARAVSHAAFFRGDFALTKKMEAQAADYARPVGDAALLGAATKGMAWAERALYDPAAGEHFEQAVEPLRSAGDTPSLVDALLGRAEVAWAEGQVTAGRSACEEALAAAGDGDPATLAQALLFSAFGACLAGDLQAADGLLTRGQAVGGSIEDALWAPICEVFVQRLAALRGEQSAAVAALGGLIARAEASGIIIGLAAGWWAKGLSAYEGSEQGESVPELETGARVALLTGFPYLSAELAATRARAAVGAGDLDEASAACEEALATASMPYGGYGRPAALLAASETAEARGEYAEALRLAHEALDGADAGGNDLAVLAALERLGRLRVAAADYDEASVFFAATDAERESRGIVVPRVDAAQHARARAAAGERAVARGSRADAVAFARRGRGRRSRPSIGWESLTPTEGAVVRLVAQGLTNPQIAAEMFVASATVKTHLKSVFAKLGVKSRAELAAHASSRG